LTVLNDRISAMKRGDLVLQLGNRQYIVPMEAIEYAPFPFGFFLRPIIFYSHINE